MDYPEEPYDFGGTESWERRMRHYLKIVSDKFHYYLSIDAKYYEIQGTVALSKYQDADSDYVIYDYPAQIEGQWIWGKGQNPTEKDLARIKLRKNIFHLNAPYSPPSGSSIEEGYIQKVLIKELGAAREEVDYLIKFYQDSQYKQFPQ